MGLAGRRLRRSAKVSMRRWKRGSQKPGCKAAEGLGLSAQNTRRLELFWSRQSGTTCEIVGDQQSPVVQELPHQRHLWDSNPRGETPSA